MRTKSENKNLTHVIWCSSLFFYFGFADQGCPGQLTYTSIILLLVRWKTASMPGLTREVLAAWPQLVAKFQTQNVWIYSSSLLPHELTLRLLLLPIHNGPHAILSYKNLLKNTGLSYVKSVTVHFGSPLLIFPALIWVALLFTVGVPYIILLYYQIWGWCWTIK